jgi:arylsulfatase A-like enzyme
MNRTFLLPLTLLACSSLFAQPSGRKNVIVLLLDQLRADRLSTYGNSRPSSPYIDRMAIEGVQLDRFYSNAPWTGPSQGTLVTSQHPSTHGETLFAMRSSPPAFPSYPTIAETFQAAGYKTAAFVNNPVAGPYLTGRGIGHYDLRQGFFGLAPSTGGPTVDRILSWLDSNSGAPFYMYVVLWEPHNPYNPPPAHDLFRNQSYPEYTSAGFGAPVYDLFRLANLGDRKAIERIIQLYDGKIHEVDETVGRLMNGLRLRGLKQNTIVMLTSDHGELLYSHPEDYLTADHRSLYDAAVHVPAIFWGAGIPENKRVNGIASHLDTAPTLLDIAGAPALPGAQGKSLAPMILSGVQSVNEFVYAEQDLSERLRSVRDSRYKLIFNPETGVRQLFDTVKDPREEQDLVAIFPNRTEWLSGVLEDWTKRFAPPATVLEERYRATAPRSPVIDELTTGGNLHLNGIGWLPVDCDTCYLKRAYVTDGIAAGETPRTATWRTDNVMRGLYRISIWFGAVPGGLSSEIPVTVQTANGPVPFRVNPARNPGAWQELGTFEDPVSVTLTNETRGRVMVDAVQFDSIR